MTLEIPYNGVGLNSLMASTPFLSWLDIYVVFIQININIIRLRIHQ